MMNDNIDSILAAYVDAVDRPGGARLDEWVKRYPQHEAALIRFAVYRQASSGAETSPQLDPGDEQMFLEKAARLRQKFLTDTGRQPVTSFQGVLSSAQALGLTTQQLAARLGIGISALTKLDRRLFKHNSIPGELISRLAECLSQQREAVLQYLSLPPRLSHSADYRAKASPRVQQQDDFADYVAKCSDMSPEQKSYWSDTVENTE